MARTKSSENENSDDDEVILRVKKKNVMESELKNDHNHDDHLQHLQQQQQQQQKQNQISSVLLSQTSTTLPQTSLSLPSSPSPVSCCTTSEKMKSNKIFYIKSYSCVEKTTTTKNSIKNENNTCENNNVRKSSIDLSGIKFLLESDQFEVWRQDGNSLVIPTNIKENDDEGKNLNYLNHCNKISSVSKPIRPNTLSIAKVAIPTTTTTTIPVINEINKINDTTTKTTSGNDYFEDNHDEKFDTNTINHHQQRSSPFRRESFLRHSLNTIRRSLNRSLSNRSSTTSNSSPNQSPLIEDNKLNNAFKVDNPIEEESDCLTKLNNNLNDQSRIVRFFRPGSTVSSCSSSGRSTSSVSIGIRSSSGSPMAPLQSQSETHGQSIIGLNNIAKSPSHQNNNKLDSKSSKQVNPSTPVTASTGRSISPHPKSSSSSSALVTVKNEIPEKEKKRKELSSSRQKKFHRHFQQVPKDEKVLNYFSCALVSDILLQGHLYITEQHFAFYSNVFGFVTKLLIPTASVIKISKEKTAKIIPNAVGVATADERHVFGSFMSREAAFRLMCSVCQPLEPIETIIVPKIPDVEVSEEYSVEDDSSCSISGNESPPQLIDSGTTSTTTTTSDASQTVRQRKLPAFDAPNIPDVVDGKIEDIPESAKIIITPPSSLLNSSSCSSNTPIKLSKSPPPRIISSSTNAIKIKFPTDFHIVYLGLVLTIVLALLSGFLLYRILDIEAKTNYRTSLDFNWSPDSDEDVYAKALKWQKEMQTKSTEEAQIILNTNLEEIAKVRRSLETLSILIHDKNKPLEDDNRGYVKDTESLYDHQEQ